MTSREKLILAIEKGYYVTKDGTVYSKFGKMNPYINTVGRKVITLKHKLKNHKIAVHRIVAYQKYGELLFKEGTVVRHLDGNPLNNTFENIAIGTMSDNMMDQSKEVRQRKPRFANKKYSEEFLEILKKERDKGATYKELSNKYKMVYSTLSYYLGKDTCKRKQVFFKD